MQITINVHHSAGRCAENRHNAGFMGVRMAVGMSRNRLRLMAVFGAILPVSLIVTPLYAQENSEASETNEPPNDAAEAYYDISDAMAAEAGSISESSERRTASPRPIDPVSDAPDENSTDWTRIWPRITGEPTEAAAPLAAQPVWTSDAQEIRYISYKIHSNMLSEHRIRYGPNGEISQWMARVRSNSGTFSPGVQTIRASRFPQRLVFGIILICNREDQTKHYYLNPIQFDNTSLNLPEYRTNNFMCGQHM